MIILMMYFIVTSSIIIIQHIKNIHILGCCWYQELGAHKQSSVHNLVALHWSQLLFPVCKLFLIININNFLVSFLKKHSQFTIRRSWSSTLQPQIGAPSSMSPTSPSARHTKETALDFPPLSLTSSLGIHSTSPLATLSRTRWPTSPLEWNSISHPPPSHHLWNHWYFHMTLNLLKRLKSQPQSLSLPSHKWQISRQASKRSSLAQYIHLSRPPSLNWAWVIPSIRHWTTSHSISLNCGLELTSTIQSIIFRQLFN